MRFDYILWIVTKANLGTNFELITNTTNPQANAHRSDFVQRLTLVEQLQKSPDATGGNFGVGYRATRESETAFVKAVDFVKAMGEPDPMAELLKLTSDAKFEQDVLAYCTKHGMSRVMRNPGDEYLQLDPNDLMSQVSCLIMEVGDEDLRRLMNHHDRLHVFGR